MKIKRRVVEDRYAGEIDRGYAVDLHSRAHGSMAVTTQLTSRRVDEVVRGPIKSKTVFPVLILHLVGQQPDHGYGLMQRIEEICGDLVAVNTNKIYPLLRRLEERGFVSASWDHPTKRSRRVYAITPAGRGAAAPDQDVDASIPRFDRTRRRTVEKRTLRPRPRRLRKL